MIIPLTIEGWLLFIVLTIWLFVLTIIAHELGHYVTMVAYDLKPYFVLRGINPGVKTDYYNIVAKRKKKIIALNGILAGLVPLILFSEGALLFVFIMMYLAGTSKDLAYIIRGV